ncbi:hypothetical protein N3K66_005646 [Trichothecium roseum]|uniref:Uncharacterized protein n=1 Tax=Trichothecium roseum TaxID=47278 RepID=A0ACC0UZ65_9HYPO|nr:hypothetical protein N3K66_005646 [Trichothecium roseum]
MAGSEGTEDQAPPPSHDQIANDASNLTAVPEEGERAAKRLKTEDTAPQSVEETPVPGSGLHDAPVKDDDQKGQAESRKGVAPIKKEYLIEREPNAAAIIDEHDDDAAEGRTSTTDGAASGPRDKKDKQKGRQKQGGQNTERSFGSFDDAIRLCNTRAFHPEFSPAECRFGDRCKSTHDLRKYLAEGRREDVETLGGKCPVFEQYGRCPSGWKCRFVKSHMKEVEHEDGRKELVLVDNTKPSDVEMTTEADNTTAPKDGDAGKDKKGAAQQASDEQRLGIYNVVSMGVKIDLSRKRTDFAKADEYITWANKEAKLNDSVHQRRKQQSTEDLEDIRAQYVDPPFKASEKRRLYFGPETPALAPLTTQGNLPFRRLCVELGAQLTYSEMAMSMPLVQGDKKDWTLLKAHESEISPPKFPEGKIPVFDGYDHSRDLKFAAQISASAPWTAIKATDALSRFCPHLRLIDLNCGCPIDMVFKAGGGSALLESTGKLERMIRGMNTLSGEIPITAKIRTGVRSSRPTANQVIEKLAFGSREHRDRLGAPGCAAITLHGRSREQRYTKKADWNYIAECAALVKSYNVRKAELTDTAAEPDARDLPNTKDGKIFFLGNGDCFSHVDYQDAVEKSRVDTVMIGRGALIKPWLFEEIEKGQYLDKSASERLTYIEKFVRYGLEAWGSDEVGIGFTRRFLLEWLSFAHRYVPVGLLEYLPPSMNDRPPAYRGRNDLETLMASQNYKDWVKISEMFLGPTHPGFQFAPKHKSNAYEAEG